MYIHKYVQVFKQNLNRESRRLRPNKIDLRAFRYVFAVMNTFECAKFLRVWI